MGYGQKLQKITLFLRIEGTPPQEEEPTPQEIQLAWFQVKLEEPDLTYEQLLAKTRINLINKGITELPTGIFNDLSSLGGLLLSNNSLKSLPTGIFNDLNSLEYLELSNNSLKSLPTGIFAKLSSLTDLELDGNALGDACDADPNLWFTDGTDSIAKPDGYRCD